MRLSRRFIFQRSIQRFATPLLPCTHALPAQVGAPARVIPLDRGFAPDG